MTRKAAMKDVFRLDGLDLAKKKKKRKPRHVKQCMVRQIGCSAEEATVLVRLFCTALTMTCISGACQMN